ncbi:MAG: efflux RND transporter permease subunit, partial [Candidatus Kapaibacteriota bacterium]
MSITEISIKRPSLIVVIFTILSVLGVISYSKLNYELLPKFSSPFVTISTIYPGASPQEVESSVSKKIEDAISSIENIKTIRTISQENVSIVMVELLPSADAEYGLREAQRKINEVINQLPENIKTPSVQKFALDEMPIIRLGVNSNLKPTEFFDLVKNKINPVLASIEGVA